MEAVGVEGQSVRRMVERQAEPEDSEVMPVAGRQNW